MSSTIGKVMTNKFRVEDWKGLYAAIAPWESQGLSVEASGEEACRVAQILGTEGLPSYMDDDDGNEMEFLFEKSVMPFVRGGEVVVVQEVYCQMNLLGGACSSLFGSAMAYVREGDTVKSAGITLDNIYDLALAKFGRPANHIEKR